MWRIGVHEEAVGYRGVQGESQYAPERRSDCAVSTSLGGGGSTYLGGLEGPSLDDRTDSRGQKTDHLHLTVREIRGLLTRHAQEVVHGMRAMAPIAASEEVQSMSFREFVQLMEPVITMN